MILYSVASPPLNLPFSHYVMCIAGCVVRHHHEATLSTWLPMPVQNGIPLLWCRHNNVGRSSVVLVGQLRGRSNYVTGIENSWQELLCSCYRCFVKTVHMTPQEKSSEVGTDERTGTGPLFLSTFQETSDWSVHEQHVKGELGSLSTLITTVRIKLTTSG